MDVLDKLFLQLLLMKLSFNDRDNTIQGLSLNEGTRKEVGW